MPNPELQNDILEAREELSPLAVNLQGLLQMWHMFQSARIVSQEFHDRFDELTYQLKMACTRSMIVDYFKPWSGNFSPEINSLKQYTGPKAWTYPFLDTIVETDMHNQLKELRNSTVAHLDQDYEGGGLSLKGVKIINAPDRGKQEGTLDGIFLPGVTVMAGIRGIWWLSDRDKIQELHAHFDLTIDLVQNQIRDLSAHFRKCCLDHMHVLEELGDLFGIVEVPIEEGNAHITPHADNPKPLALERPKELTIGEQNVQSLVTVYETRSGFPTDSEVKGKGYWLRLGSEAEVGKINCNVSFPKYPAPKEKLK